MKALEAYLSASGVTAKAAKKPAETIGAGEWMKRTDERNQPKRNRKAL